MKDYKVWNKEKKICMKTRNKKTRKKDENEREGKKGKRKIRQR